MIMFYNENKWRNQIVTDLNLWWLIDTFIFGVYVLMTQTQRGVSIILPKFKFSKKKFYLI